MGKHPRSRGSNTSRTGCGSDRADLDWALRLNLALRHNVYLCLNMIAWVAILGSLLSLELLMLQELLR